jgi:hypothetical protein
MNHLNQMATFEARAHAVTKRRASGPTFEDRTERTSVSELRTCPDVRLVRPCVSPSFVFLHWLSFDLPSQAIPGVFVYFCPSHYLIGYSSPLSVTSDLSWHLELPKGMVQRRFRDAVRSPDNVSGDAIGAQHLVLDCQMPSPISSCIDHRPVVMVVALATCG